MSVLPEELLAARDSVLYSNVGCGPLVNSTYTHYSPTFPNPLITFPEVIYSTLEHFNESLPWNGLTDWFSVIWEYHYVDVYISKTNIFHILFMALFLTIVRHIATEALLKKIPVWYDCVKSEGEKFPEAAFRACIYSIAWTWTAYVSFNHNYFYEPIKTMIFFVPGVAFPSDVYWLYIFELGLYIHSIYATLFVEVIRRDFAVQLIHHVVTIMLLGYSFSVRLYAFGILVLFMHDLGDALMETAKCFVYFKVRGGKQKKIPDLIGNILFGLFTLNWIMFRLYWLPVKAIYTIGHVSKKFMHFAPHYLLPNILLWVLYVLHWYWFYFIAKLVISVVTGSEAVNDNRDYEEEDKTRSKKKTS